MVLITKSLRFLWMKLSFVLSSNIKEGPTKRSMFWHICSLRYHFHQSCLGMVMMTQSSLHLFACLFFFVCFLFLLFLEYVFPFVIIFSFDLSKFNQCVIFPFPYLKCMICELGYVSLTVYFLLFHIDKRGEVFS